VSKSRMLRAVLACVSIFPAGVAVAAVSAATVATVIGVAPASAATVPVGYTDIVVGNAPQPTAISKTATGEVLVTSQTGQLWSFAPNGTRTQLLAFADICSNSERGLLGVTNDVGAATGSFVYLYATRRVGAGGACVNRVSRFPWNSSSIALASEEVLVTNIPSVAGNHNGGDIALGKDGNLYVGIGDSGCYPNGGGCGPANTAARDNGWLAGKIVRVTRTGGIPADNPFVGAGTVRCNQGGTAGGATCQEIFATGLRNPFRLAFDPSAATTRFNINDVGQDTWEEIDAGIAGADYGWNLREGPCATGSTTNCGTVAGLANPVYAYPHSEGCDTLTGGAFSPSTWSEPAGTYFYAEYSCGSIFKLTPNGSGGFTRSTFSNTVGSIVDLKNFGDGSLYYSSYSGGGQVHRITFDAVAPPFTPGKFVPLTPTRVMDTRNGLGFSGGRVGDGTISLSLAGSVPSTAVAVAYNVTATDNLDAGFLTLWPSGTRKPDTSSVNFAAGEDVANAAVVAVGPAGAMNVYSSSATHVVVDVTGYWLPVASATDGRFVPLAEPRRIADTRTESGSSVPVGKVAAGASIDVIVQPPSGVAANNASAVAITVTAVNTSGAGFVTVWPTGSPRPLASTLNPNGAGDVRANLVMLPLGTGGKVSVYTSTSADIVVDLVGTFTTSAAPNAVAGLLQMVPLNRVLDTRGRARVAANSTTTYAVNGTVALPAAAIFNLTATATGASGYLTAFPTDRTTVPVVSNVNASAPGQSRAALSITRTPAAATPSVKVFSSMPTDVLIDVAGYFLPAPTS
jgi:glucose/arabinose dehydrogenase